MTGILYSTSSTVVVTLGSWGQFTALVVIIIAMVCWTPVLGFLFFVKINTHHIIQKEGSVLPIGQVTTLVVTIAMVC